MSRVRWGLRTGRDAGVRRVLRNVDREARLGFWFSVCSGTR